MTLLAVAFLTTITNAQTYTDEPFSLPKLPPMDINKVKTNLTNELKNHFTSSKNISVFDDRIVIAFKKGSRTCRCSRLSIYH